uniref:Bone morphogenetic protein 15 n=1 Tax=Hucho hucho TaxID=62062 RepID=A0A4W5KC74_9TELE
MRATHRNNTCILSFVLLFLCTTFTRADGKKGNIPTNPSASSQSHLGGRCRRNHHNTRQKRPQEPLHTLLTDAQKADQNLQYMLSLFKSAADPDGRPKQHRLFGSNTVRLLRPNTTQVWSRTASSVLRYTYAVKYDLQSLSLEQLVRASFVHLRPSSTSRTPHPSPLRCRARVTSLGHDSWTSPPEGLGRLVTLEPHQQWTETDITEHLTTQVVTLTQGKPKLASHLTLMAQYWCLDPGHWRCEALGGLWMIRGGHRRGKRAASANHLNAPALLLFLNEEEENREWRAPHHLSAHRLRRSNGPSPPGSIVSDIPNYRKHKKPSPKNQCKLHSYRVTFAALGLVKYLAPHQYNPGYCKGDCPRILHYGLNPSSHAIMQNLIKGKGMDEVPSLSCVPYKYKPISVLMLLDDNKTVDYKEIPDMIAESCTCR